MSWHSRFVDAGIAFQEARMDGVSTAVIAATATVAVKRKKRQHRSSAERLRVVEETLVPGASVALVARAHGVNANQVFAWRKLYLTGKLIDKSSKAITQISPRLLPVTVSDADQHLGAIVADTTTASAPIPCSTPTPSGSIQIQFPKAQVRVEGCADASALRVVLECLLR
jgi:transposase